MKPNTHFLWRRLTSILCAFLLGSISVTSFAANEVHQAWGSVASERPIDEIFNIQFQTKIISDICHFQIYDSACTTITTCKAISSALVNDSPKLTVTPGTSVNVSVKIAPYKQLGYAVGKSYKPAAICLLDGKLDTFYPGPTFKLVAASNTANTTSTVTTDASPTNNQAETEANNTETTNVEPVDKVSVKPPVAETLPTTKAPSPPDSLKVTCQYVADSSLCPVITWNGYTYWAYSYRDNRVSLNISAYDCKGNLAKQWEKSGTRYIRNITVDDSAKTVSFVGQYPKPVVMNWSELLSLPSVSCDEAVNVEPAQVEKAAIEAPADVSKCSNDVTDLSVPTNNLKSAVGESCFLYALGTFCSVQGNCGKLGHLDEKANAQGVSVGSGSLRNATGFNVLGKYFGIVNGNRKVWVQVDSKSCTAIGGAYSDNNIMVGENLCNETETNSTEADKVSIKPPVAETLPKTKAPSPPDSLKVTCQYAADSSLCPIVTWNGYTYWAYSYRDNRGSLNISAYDCKGNLAKQWEKSGTRYIRNIIVDDNAETVSFVGQSPNPIVMKWSELLALPPVSCDEVDKVEPAPAPPVEKAAVEEPAKETCDAEPLVNGVGGWTIGRPDPNGQSFTSPYTADLTNITLWHYTDATVTLDIYEGEGLSGKKLHSQTMAIKMSPAGENISLSSPVAVSKDAVYTWYISGINAQRSNKDAYAGGQAYKRGNPTANDDLRFALTFANNTSCEAPVEKAAIEEPAKEEATIEEKSVTESEKVEVPVEKTVVEEPAKEATVEEPVAEVTNVEVPAEKAEVCKDKAVLSSENILTIPFVKLQVIDSISEKPTGEFGLWQISLVKVSDSTSRYKLHGNPVKIDNSDSECPAVYTLDKGLLLIPYVEAPTSFNFGDKNLEGDIQLFQISLIWEPVSKSFVVTDVRQADSSEMWDDVNQYFSNTYQSAKEFLKPLF
ncbi:hypothetical protein QUF74_12215 [Candidatus Halobeggiatoa sp. HSG11]|nr:hypothetical protein [Candidatus Halobeggiatoa sp. HSG11]